MPRKNFPGVMVALAIVLLAGCATTHIDGDAVECMKCRAMWVRLFAESASPGFYLLDEEQRKPPPCPRCQELSVDFFESGVLLRRCPDCGGKLVPRTVNLVR